MGSLGWGGGLGGKVISAESLEGGLALCHMRSRDRWGSRVSPRLSRMVHHVFYSSDMPLRCILAI